MTIIKIWFDRSQSYSYQMLLLLLLNEWMKKNKNGFRRLYWHSYLIWNKNVSQLHIHVHINASSHTHSCIKKGTVSQMYIFCLLFPVCYNSKLNFPRLTYISIHKMDMSNKYAFQTASFYIIVAFKKYSLKKYWKKYVQYISKMYMKGT